MAEQDPRIEAMMEAEARVKRLTELRDGITKARADGTMTRDKADTLYDNYTQQIGEVNVWIKHLENPAAARRHYGARASKRPTTALGVAARNEPSRHADSLEAGGLTFRKVPHATGGVGVTYEARSPHWRYVIRNFAPANPTMWALNGYSLIAPNQRPMRQFDVTSLERMLKEADIRIKSHEKFGRKPAIKSLTKAAQPGLVPGTTKEGTEWGMWDGSTRSAPSHSMVQAALGSKPVADKSATTTTEQYKEYTITTERKPQREGPDLLSVVVQNKDGRTVTNVSAREDERAAKHNMDALIKDMKEVVDARVERAQEQQTLKGTELAAGATAAAPPSNAASGAKAVSTKEAASLTGYDSSHIVRMARNGQIEGAYKDAKAGWQIPVPVMLKRKSGTVEPLKRSARKADRSQPAAQPAPKPAAQPDPNDFKSFKGYDGMVFQRTSVERNAKGKVNLAEYEAIDYEHNIAYRLTYSKGSWTVQQHKNEPGAYVGAAHKEYRALHTALQDVSRKKRHVSRVNAPAARALQPAKDAAQRAGNRGAQPLTQESINKRRI